MNDTTETLAENLAETPTKDLSEKVQDKCLVTLYAPPALEETLVDFLLENNEIHGFSTTEAYGHGQRPSGMTLLEQVTGRQRRIQFKIETEQTYVATLLDLLSQKFVGLHYMVTPLLAAGRL